MKNKISIKNILQAMFVVAIVTLFIGVAFGLSAIATSIVGLVLFSASFIKRNEMVLYAGLYPEVWTKEIVKRFNENGTAKWRDGIPDKSQYTSMTADGETVVINITAWGGRPTVLIDNNTYPIPIEDLNAENIPISLRKFSTLATKVTDDEVRGLAYDKIRVVQESHAVEIEDKANALAIHSIAPVNNNNAAAGVPVLLTTGADDGTGRKKLLVADILKLKKAWDDALIPEGNRRLVLCSDHVNDLLGQSQSFDNQYYNWTTGKIANMFGFELFTYGSMPYYNAATKTKLSFDGVAVAGTHFKASVAFHLSRVGQAKGFTKAYISESKNDPLYQRNLLNYRHYDVVIPIKAEGLGAIVSAAV